MVASYQYIINTRGENEGQKECWEAPPDRRQSRGIPMIQCPFETHFRAQHAKDHSAAVKVNSRGRRGPFRFPEGGLFSHSDSLFLTVEMMSLEWKMIAIGCNGDHLSSLYKVMPNQRLRFKCDCISTKMEGLEIPIRPFRPTISGSISRAARVSS